jgi:ABC-type sugar transport system ATPase subunit
VASADTDELAALCHKVFVFKEGRLMQVLEGGDLTARKLSRAFVADRNQVTANV